MTYRLIFELVLFLTPFMAFGIWRIATEEAVEDGREPWPITILFGVGAALAVLAWVILILIDRGGGETCLQRAYFEDGHIVPTREVPCEKHRDELGLPASRDPGSQAPGLGGVDPAGPNLPAGPLDPAEREQLPSEDRQQPEDTSPQ